MELPALLVGLSGIIPIVEKSLELWQSISEANEFGTEMMKLVAMLSIEYHRFLAWARVLQQQPPGSTAQQLDSQSIGGIIFPNDLNIQFQHPIESAAAQIVTILDEVAEIARKYKVKDSSPPEKPASIAVGLSTVLPIVGATHNPNVTSIIARNHEWGRILQEKTSLRRRFTFTSRPWGRPDHTALEKKVKELSYWNNRLEGLLPNHIRLSLSRQAPLTQILTDENEALLETLIKASEHQNEAVKAHAMLWRERIEFANMSQARTTDMVKKYRRDALTLDPVPGAGSSKCSLSLVTIKDDQGPPSLAVVEWYPYGKPTWSPSDITLASSRLAQIVHLSSVEARPSSLRVPDSICFAEKPECLGLVIRLPPDASRVKQPVSLYSLLTKAPEVVSGFRPPSLEQRLFLAQQLASSVYSFGVVRWYHKDLNSWNIIFFRDSTASATLMFESPYVTGFSISRPDSKTEKSLNKDLEARTIYLHPSLRVVDPEKRPRYHLKYEMYSLGLLLFEIGVWRTLDRIVDASLPPPEFKTKVIDRCNKDLPFFTGSRYREIVLRCLRAADEDLEGTDGSLDTLYWSVVLELAKCR
ncbi:hypothetical protein BJX62DRAFT_233868 [Aspergillus germanicus]